MDYKELARGDLKAYNKIKTGITNLIDLIHELESSIDGVKAADFSDERIQRGKGDNPEEQRVINTMAQLNNLRPTLDYSLGKIERMDRALAQLTDQQHMILDRFHINRPHAHIQVLCAELGYEKSKIYELYDEAMRDFTIALYSIVDG